MIEKDFNRILKKYDLEDIFSLGLYNKFDNVNRIYLDEINKKGMELYRYLLSFLEKQVLKKITGKTFYVVVLAHTWNDEKSFPKNKIEELKNLKIDIPELNIYRKIYSDDDEWFNHYLFFQVNTSQINKFINASIANNFDDVEPYSSSDFFLLDHDLTSLINIYDDRGMDIMSLELE